MSNEWNITTSGKQTYKFKFTLNLSALIEKEVKGNIFDYFGVDVEKTEDRDDYEFTMKDLLPAENMIECLKNSLNEDLGMITTTLNFQRFWKAGYKTAYDEKRMYDNQINLAKQGKTEWPKGTAPEYEIVRQLNKKYDKEIQDIVKNTLGRYFIQAVIEKLKENRLPDSKNEDDELDYLYLFDGKTFGDIARTFERLKSLM